MNGVRPLALILAALAVGMTLASMWPHLAGGQAALPAEVVEGAVLRQSCVDDASVTVDAVWEGFTYTLADPPDYADGDDIWIAYTVTNNSCGDVTVTVALTGSVSNAAIHDADGSTAPCADGCTVPAGSSEYGTVQWDLSKHPNATGEKVVATVTVTAPDGFVDANPDNNTATSEQWINIVNEEPDPAPDISVKSVSASRNTAVIGETVNFTVVVQNEGDADADADTTVTLHLGEDTAALDSATVSALAVDGESTVTLEWDTDGAAAGEHSVRALGQTEGDGNADNDSKSVTVTLAEPLVDVAVKSITASATEAVVGNTVDFTVTLENGGNVRAVSPEVSLFDADGAEDAEPLETVTADTIPVGDTKTVTISWDTDEADAGTYTLRAVATVADDDDASNDSATASLTLHNPVDVELSLTSPVASSAVGGTSISVPFTITNSGNHDTGEVTVSLYVAAEGEERGEQEPTATTTVSTIAVDGSANGSFDWDTADVAVGRYRLEVVIHTVGDTDETNNELSHSIEIRNWILLKDVSPTSANAVTGDTVEFTAQVENVGMEELTDLAVGLYEAGTDSALAEVDFASVAAGDTADATVRWDTAGRDVGQVHVFVAVGAEGQVPDADDTQTASVTIRNPIALTSATPAYADNIAGIPVSINVQVLNESIAEVTDVEVKLDDDGDCEDEADEEAEKENGCAAIATIAAIPAGETGAVALVWDTADAKPGDHELKIVANVAGYSSDANDELSPTVTLRAPVADVALTAATIDRNMAAIGQTLNVVATVTNHGEVLVTAPVVLYLVAGDQGTTAAFRGTSSPIEPGASGDVALHWDSTGETVGTHTLKIAVELPQDTTTDDNGELFEIELFRSAFDGAHDVDSCAEDVRVQVTDILDLGDQNRSPPSYYVGETIRVAYSVYNFSCQTDLTLVLTMNGPEGHAITDAEALCFSDCIVPFGGKAEGEVKWTIPTLPALSDQPIESSVTVASPSDYVEVDETNNSNASTDLINIVHPDDVVVRVEENTDNKASKGQSMIGPEFGTVDVRLVSASPLQTVLPFAAESVEVAVEMANDGPTAEPTAVRFVMAPDDGTSPRELVRHTMVIPAGQTRTETVEVPLRDILPGIHTIDVLLSAAVDQSPGNNAATVGITRLGPKIDVDLADVSVSPEVLVLGDDATVSLTVQNDSEITLPLNLALYLGDGSEPAATKTLYELAPGNQSQEQISWQVPASARMLGPQTLKMVASSSEFGAVATVGSEVTLHIDSEILRINTLPGETAMQGEEVAVEVKVRNNGPATVNVPVTLRFPSATKGPVTRRPPVPAGSTGTARFSWKTRDYSVGEHMLTATVPEQHNITSGETSAELPFQLSLLTITATIVDVAPYPEFPSVGEPISIAVTVRNDGPVATRISITLHYPPGGRQPETRQPHVAPGGTGTATFEWLTSRHAAGTHQFRVEVAAVDTPQRRFTIDLLPTLENVSIVGMGTYPVETAMVGEPVEVWVEVRNDGPLPLNVPVRLRFPSAGKRPATSSPRVDPGETARVRFEWRTGNYEPGDHTLTAAILLDDNITLGPTTDEVGFTLTPLIINAAIVDLAVSPEAPRVGEPATITVTVRNDGRIAANIPVRLHFPPGGRKPEPRSPRVDVGDMGEAVFTWHTGQYEPGMHDFRVEVASAPPYARQFTVELLPPIVDVAIVSMGSDPSETAVQGQEVKIWVDVINNGPSALDVPVQLVFPSSHKQPERKSSRIEPGETARLWFEWKTANYGLGVHLLTAELLAEYNIAELGMLATIEIKLVPAQLIASIVDISWSPESPVVGDPVRIMVSVRNDGLLAANIPVTLHFPSGDRQPETRRPRVEPGAIGSADFTWRTSRYQPGDHVFVVEVAGDPPSTHQFTVELLPPIVDVAIVSMGSDPSETAAQGQEVKIWVDVINNGPSALDVPVQLAFPSSDKNPERKSSRIEPGEIGRLWFEWKTANYDLGVHFLTAAVLAEYNIAELGMSATIVIKLVPARLIASIVDVSWSPEPPVVGEPVRIMVSVRNDGLLAANIPVTLRFPSGDRQPETRRPRVDPGAIGSAAFTWRTSRYQPGDHVFVVEVVGDPPSTHQFTVELLPPIVDVSIVSMGSEPSETAVQGQTVKIWVDVINNGPSALDVPVQLSFPPSDKQPERKSSRIEPGEIGRLWFEWKTTNYDLGVHFLTAAVLAEYNIAELGTSATIVIRLVPAQLMASIVDVSWSPEFPVVGEPVRITVSVRNDGVVAANIPVTLRFPSGDRQPETRRPRVEPGAVGSAEFLWLTSRYQPGDHVFVVEVAGDPPSTHQFTVELFPPTVDVSIVSMGSDPSETAVQGQTVKIWVDVINNGPSALNVPVQLAFPSSDKQPERKSPRIEPGEIARVEFIWKTGNYDPGIHALTAELLAEYNIAELGASATIVIRLVPAQLMASILDISWSPDSPVVGEAVRITVAVRNDGLVAANIPVTLYFPSGDRQPETRRPRVEPGAVGSAEFLWRTGRYQPGDHVFVVEVVGDLPSTHQFTVELFPPTVDVSIVSMGSDPSETAVRGQEVKIWVDVINNGPSALNVPVQLTFPSSDKQPERKSPRIEPGEIARVEFVWKTGNYDPGIHALTAELLAEYNIAELNTSATIEIKLIPAQLIASIVDVSWSPEPPVVGEPVRIMVSVRNDGLVAANIPVTLYFPSGDRQPETRRPRVLPGAVGTTSFTWRTSRYEPGDHLFRVQIPGVAGAVREFEIELLPPEVDFAVLDFKTPDPLHPIVKGDWVEITVVLQNQGPYPGRGTVYLLNGANPDAMYEQAASLEPGEFREVEFTWKTLRYPVGGYELLARVDAKHDTDPSNDRSDLAPVHLLTDRDITVGFGSAVRPSVFAEPTSAADLSSIPRYRQDIVVVGNSQPPLDRPVVTPSDAPMGVSPKPAGGDYDPARMYWRWRSAQVSPWECARYQRTVGESQPRAVACPRAPALVR